MNKKKRFWIILIGIILVICFLPLPTRINKKMIGTGFYPKGHELESVVTEETIQIKGWYLRFLLWDNRFWGDIHVVSEDPEHNRMFAYNSGGIRFMKEKIFQGQWSPLAYYDGKIYDFVFPGRIIEDDAFDEVLYISHVSDCHMAFPAIGREEAVALANKLHLKVE